MKLSLGSVRGGVLAAVALALVGAASAAAIDTPLAKAAAVWTAALEKVPATASEAKIAAPLGQPSPAYEAALHTFDAKLAAIHLPGRAGTDAEAVIRDDTKLVTLIESAGKLSKSQFQQGFAELFRTEAPLQLAFRKDLGLPADSAIQI